MRKVYSFQIIEPSVFIERLLLFSKQYSRSCLLTSNEWEGSRVDMIAAMDAVDEIQPSSNTFETLKDFWTQKKDWLFGHLSYDLKNEVEELTSANNDELGFSVMHFFQPKYVFILKNSSVEVHYLSAHCSEDEIKNIAKEIMMDADSDMSNPAPVLITHPRISKDEYLHAVSSIQKHIAYGDIYEMNYCMEFFSERTEIEPADLFLKLNRISQAPFSAYYRLDEKYLLCASPERFLKKSGSKILSQPIKGTARRGKTPAEDKQIKDQLLNNNKDRSENVMIVDLVRNDLSKTCEAVTVDELFGVYSFKQWHQMISSVSGTIREGVHFIDVIKNAFPMGSMTGAPKVKAMELIDRYEKTKRGMFSGAVGYLSPDGDFDLNVVIRSILYNKNVGYLSFMVGSAITANSIPEHEYEECLLKAKGIFEALRPNAAQKKEMELLHH